MKAFDQYSEDELKKVQAVWERLIEKSKEKKKDFDTTGKELMRYYSEKHAFIYGNTTEDYAPKAWAQATVNKTYEAVEVFAPKLYFQAPARRITCRQAQDDPFGRVLQKLLDYTAIEMDLKLHGRRANLDGIIKGRGVLWTELDAKTGFPINRYISVDDLQVDPDTRGIEDSYWIARKRWLPIWELKRKYPQAKDVRPTRLKGEQPDQSESQETCVYWEIYSKMGDGLRATRMDGEREALDSGPGEDFVFLVIVPGYEKPIYLGKWPTPYWADTKTAGWPGSFLDFADVPNSPWPMSILKPGLPLQNWLDWAYSFLLQKVARTGRDVVAMAEGLGQEKAAVLKNIAGLDCEVLRLPTDQMAKLNEIFQVLQFPPMNGDLIKAIEMAEMVYERITGVSELLSLGSTQVAYRSAEEARMKGENAHSRIDDMVDRVETWMTAISRKEAICARWHLEPDRIAEFMGPEAAETWGVYKAGDLPKLMREYQYQIEAGSTQRPDEAFYISQADRLMQGPLPLLLQTGSLESANNILRKYYKALKIREDEAEAMLFATTVVNGQQLTPAQQQQMEAEQAGAQTQLQEAESQRQLEVQNSSGANETQAAMAAEKNAAALQIADLNANVKLLVAEKQAQARAAAARKPGNGK